MVAFITVNFDTVSKLFILQLSIKCFQTTQNMCRNRAKTTQNRKYKIGEINKEQRNIHKPYKKDASFKSKLNQERTSQVHVKYKIE